MSSRDQQDQTRKRPREEERDAESSPFDVAEAIASQLQRPSIKPIATKPHQQGTEQYQNPAGNTYLTNDPGQVQNQPFEGPVWDDIFSEVEANDVSLKRASTLAILD